MDKILGEDGPPNRRARFGLNEFKGNHLFEIREFYLKQGEFLPTKKGINLNRNRYMELQRIINTFDDEIRTFLNIGEVDEGLLRYQQAQEEAKKANFRLVNDMVEEQVNKLPDGHLFDVKHEGAKDRVRISSSHPFAKATSDEELAALSPSDIRKLLLSMIAAYSRARSLLLHAPASSPEILFEQLEYDWSKFLGRYVEEA
jgi:hypothetical protein